MNNSYKTKFETIGLQLGWWFLCRPDGTCLVIFPRELDRLARKAKARKQGGTGGDGAA